MNKYQIRGLLDAAMAAFHLRIESRIAALCGRGYYTIGSCGEEAMSSAGHALYLPLPRLRLRQQGRVRR